MAFCNQLKKLRKRNNIKQVELANMLGVKQYVISGWETSRSEPSISQICRLAEIFEVPIDYLLDTHTIRVSDNDDFKKVERNIKMDIEDKFVVEFQNIIENLSDSQKDADIDMVKSFIKISTR